MNILIISSNYPSSAFPQRGTFVYKLVQQFALECQEVVVVSPHRKHFNRILLSENYGRELATVYRPTFWSFSNKPILKWNTIHLTNFFQARSLKRKIIELGVEPAIVYCHFIDSALLYLRAFPDSQLPLFVAVGEYKNIDIVRSYYKRSKYEELINKITGFIAVSLQVKTKLLEIGVPEDRICVEPNGTDLNLFRPRKKEKLRRKYAFPLDKKIVLFVGRFLDQKGALRALEAINQLDAKCVGIFIGKGPQNIDGDKIVYRGTVAHNQVAEFMALSDVFVLPTLHEGSSNVIIEAMASGLPIVSSDIPEIKSQCDSSFSILVDPNDVGEITMALKKITSNDNLRNEMSENALVKSRKYNLVERAKRILTFIKNNYRNHEV